MDDPLTSVVDSELLVLPASEVSVVDSLPDGVVLSAPVDPEATLLDSTASVVDSVSEGVVVSPKLLDSAPSVVDPALIEELASDVPSDPEAVLDSTVLDAASSVVDSESVVSTPEEVLVSTVDSELSVEGSVVSEESVGDGVVDSPVLDGLLSVVKNMSLSSRIIRLNFVKESQLFKSHMDTYLLVQHA